MQTRHLYLHLQRSRCTW